MQSKSKRSRRSTRAAGLVLALLTLAAVPTSAQVPQDTTFSGRLVDGAGIPLVGPATFILLIFDVPAGGSALYSEHHFGVPLDAQGNFSVLLGAGNPGFGIPPYGASLFSDPERYVEVRLVSPSSEILAPRVPIASAPWALIAQQANEIVRGPTAPRFEDCGDGTVADHQTGLQWEKKTGTVVSFIICETEPGGCPDPHVVNNIYEWSNTSTDPDGGAFTDFLAKLNDPTFGEAAVGEIYGNPPATGCFAGHCNWRLPIIDELGTILIGSDAAPGQDTTTCSSGPCIDPDFAAVGGPTPTDAFWSASTFAGDPSRAWAASHIPGPFHTGDLPKTQDLYVRAVRAGSCN